MSSTTAIGLLPDLIAALTLVFGGAVAVAVATLL